MKLSILMCQVTDMDRAVVFYRDVLELKSTLVTPDWSQFDLDGVPFGLHPKFADSGSTGQGGWTVGFESEDLCALRVRLIAAGVHVGDYHEVPGGVVLHFSDHDCNPLEATQEGISMEQAQSSEPI